MPERYRIAIPVTEETYLWYSRLPRDVKSRLARGILDDVRRMVEKSDRPKQTIALLVTRSIELEDLLPWLKGPYDGLPDAEQVDQQDD